MSHGGCAKQKQVALGGSSEEVGLPATILPGARLDLGRGATDSLEKAAVITGG